MGKKKIKKPVYHPAKQHIPPGMTYAMTMASANFHEKQEDKIRLEITGGYLDWMYAALALVCHRELGFGAVRTARMVEATQKQMLEFSRSGLNDKALWDLVRNEVGLDFDVI